ncbi:MAG: ABC transporter permease, partial [Candidatus Riflebacteria bacterium]
FGYALNMDLNKVPIIVIDHAGTPESRQLTMLFDGSPYFNIIAHAGKDSEIESYIGKGKALAGLVIPADFSKRLAGGLMPAAQFIVDGSDANTATFAMNYAESLGHIAGAELGTRFVSNPKPAGARKISIKTRAWFNQDLRSKNVIVPGVIAIVMVIIASMLTSVTVAREWETGTMEQLISTPVSRSEIVFGKVIPYFCIGFIDLLISFIVGRFLFQVPFRGNLAVLFLLSSIFLSGSLFFGLFLSIKLRRQVLANQVALMAGYLPTLFLSGFVFAIPNMPWFLQKISSIVPARYFITILRSLYLKGVGLEILWLNAVLLAAYALLFVAASQSSLKLKVE